MGYSGRRVKKSQRRWGLGPGREGAEKGDRREDGAATVSEWQEGDPCHQFGQPCVYIKKPLVSSFYRAHLLAFKDFLFT